MADYTSTPNKNLRKPIDGASNHEWGGVLNYSLDLVDASLGGTLVKKITGTIGLTSAEAANSGYEFTGIFASEATVYWPVYHGLAVVNNSTNQTVACTITSPQSVRVPAGQTIAMWGDGVRFVPFNLGPRRYRFDQAAPPAVDIFLEIGDTAYITFENVHDMAMHIATTEGLYRIFLMITWTDAKDNNIVFYPNNTYHTDLTFANWTQMNSDSDLNGVSVPTPPFLDPRPRAYGYLSQGAILIDVFSGPILADYINGVGPTMVDMMVNTTTIAKMTKSSSGVAGGAAQCVGRWYDTTTPWTSLGLFTVGQPTAGKCYGYAYVERLA